MATTVTSTRVVPKSLTLWDGYLVESFVTVDGVEVSKEPIALFVHETTANAYAQCIPTTTAED